MKIIEVWAQLYLSEFDNERIKNFFIKDGGIRSKYIIKNLHTTVYHARRPMPDLFPTTESTEIVLKTSETRFMVLSPGGENPKPEIFPKEHKVGIRIKKNSKVMERIQIYRQRLISYETDIVLGNRLPSTNRRSAFGARFFQPHIALIRSGSGMDNDLTIIGRKFRDTIYEICFDRFTVEIVSKEKEARIQE